MPVITLNGRSYPVEKEKVLLDSLLENRVKIPYSCRSGLCHACMLKADSGSPPVSSQKNLPRDKA
ncbi:MAG: 2Fe-2S iron-sulfur cluster-binding protein, partial [Endozoicomonas sp.]